MPKTRNSVTSASFICAKRGISKRLAENHSKRIQWRLLHQASNEYILCACFIFWLRSIEETVGYLPDRVWKAIRSEYPVFLDDNLPYLEKHGDAQVWKRLEDWIVQNIFRDAVYEGWMDAVVYYAVSDLRYLRTLAYYHHCGLEWKSDKQPSYPSFSQWRRAAFSSCGFPDLRPRLLQLLRSACEVSAERVTDAVERYVDWQEFAYWAATGFYGLPNVPQLVLEQLRRRCPGFVDCDARLRPADSRDKRRSFTRLLDWIITHFFRDAKRKGWFTVIDYYASRHPHCIRMKHYSSRWKHNWDSGRIKIYPSLEEWRRAIDNYVEE